jgi:phosphatidylserine/phosphatidylglycerophosphate/cardiolipin synthase-like enzyme
LLEDKNRLKIDVRIVYGKSELQPEEINWLKELSFVRTSFCKNLHAKCYINEESCIVTSLNLYEFSQVNNNEMGVYISRVNDPEMFKDTYEEAQRIIRISDEIRISLEKVNADEKENTKSGSSSVGENEKLSSSKIAKQLRLKTPEFLKKVSELGYLEKHNDKYSLTEKGTKAGGEEKQSQRFGDYFVWPTDLNI